MTTKLLFAVIYMSYVSGCGSDSDDGTSPTDTSTSTETSTDTDTSNEAPTDTSLSGIKQFLADTLYKNWTSESSVHASSVHGQVKSYFNSTLLATLRTGTSPHAVGSVSVKEIYNSSGTELIGHAFMQKVSAGTGGSSWLWYEAVGSSTPTFGEGHSSCVSCHSAGIDYVRSSAP